LNAVGRPEGMGRVERFHRSLKEECLQFAEVESLEELQHLAERYRHFYNTQRPHQALGYKTPMEVIEEAKKVVSFS
jgi:transposase InsO family protein